MYTTLSSREFDQDLRGAKQAARSRPAFITERGKPAHVLLSIESYQRLTGLIPSIIEMLAMADDEDIEFDPPRAVISFREADLS